MTSRDVGTAMCRHLSGKRDDDEGGKERTKHDCQDNEITVRAHAVWPGLQKFFVSVIVSAPAGGAKEEEHQGIGAGDKGEEIHILAWSSAPLRDLWLVPPQLAHQVYHDNHEERQYQSADNNRCPVCPRCSEYGRTYDDDGDDKVALPAQAEWAGNGML